MIGYDALRYVVIALAMANIGFCVVVALEYFRLAAKAKPPDRLLPLHVAWTASGHALICVGIIIGRIARFGQPLRANTWFYVFGLSAVSFGLFAIWKFTQKRGSRVEERGKIASDMLHRMTEQHAEREQSFAGRTGRADAREERADSREQTADNREQTADSREQQLDEREERQDDGTE